MDKVQKPSDSGKRPRLFPAPKSTFQFICMKYEIRIRVMSSQDDILVRGGIL
jgi:hypothetical protein